MVPIPVFRAHSCIDAMRPILRIGYACFCDLMCSVGLSVGKCLGAQ